MENQTSAMEFYILPFSIKPSLTFIILAIIFFIYFSGVFTNSFIILLIYCYNYLHTPMYLFICNLSIVDIFYTTVTVPKLLYIVISRKNTISYRECFIQMYFFFIDVSTENVLILAMAFDRYVAICNPLHYHRILNKMNCTFLVVGIWILGSLNAFAITFQASKMTFCHSKTIHHFFCDGKALINIACGGLKQFYDLVYIEFLIFGVCPVSCTLISYIKIIKVIFQMQSNEGRRKAFSTCSSHLIVIFMYYTAAVSVYIMPKYSDVLDEICSSFYTTITPIINPLIYSLRNRDVLRALKNVVSYRSTKRTSSQTHC